MQQDTLTDLVAQEAIRRLREGQERIHRCVGMLNDDQLWHRPNTNTVSVGNLVLHLAGNVGQWINATLGAAPDRRQRQLEFDTPAMDRRALLD